MEIIVNFFVTYYYKLIFISVVSIDVYKTVYISIFRAIEFSFIKDYNCIEHPRFF